MTFTHCWCHYNVTIEETGASQADYTESMNFVFANRNKENSIYPLTTREIVESQSKDAQIAKLTADDGYTTQLRTLKSYVRMASSSSHGTFKVEWLLGIITTCGTPIDAS